MNVSVKTRPQIASVEAVPAYVAVRVFGLAAPTFVVKTLMVTNGIVSVQPLNVSEVRLPVTDGVAGFVPSVPLKLDEVHVMSPAARSLILAVVPAFSVPEIGEL